MGFLRLPPEVHVVVLGFLDLPDLLQVRLVCELYLRWFNSAQLVYGR